jgi:hypothetical protein
LLSFPIKVLLAEAYEQQMQSYLFRHVMDFRHKFDQSYFPKYETHLEGRYYIWEIVALQVEAVIVTFVST